MREADFQKQVIDLAHLFGWRVAHFRPAQTSRGWRTAVSADGAGFPDLVLARGGFVIFAELKADKGKTSDDQEAWLLALGGESFQSERTLVVVWRPRDWPTIENAVRKFGGARS